MRSQMKLGVTVALLALALPAAARPSLATTPFDSCFEKAGAYYGINPLLLRAIARQESSMNPRAHNRNTNGTVDIGLMQINTWHMPRLAKAGVNEQRLWDPCVNIAVGAWVLADAVSRHGMTWKAVGIYHSPTEWRQRDYAAKVQRHLIREIQAVQTALGASRPAAATAPQMAVAVTPAPATHQAGAAPDAVNVPALPVGGAP